MTNQQSTQRKRPVNKPALKTLSKPDRLLKFYQHRYLIAINLLDRGKFNNHCVDLLHSLGLKDTDVQPLQLDPERVLEHPQEVSND